MPLRYSARRRRAPIARSSAVLRVSEVGHVRGRKAGWLVVTDAKRASTALWRHRDFLLLWGGQTVSQAGSQVTVLALPLVAIVILHATTFQVGLLSAAVTSAYLLFALPAGVLADRGSKRRLMLWCDAAGLL